MRERAMNYYCFCGGKETKRNGENEIALESLMISPRRTRSRNHVILIKYTRIEFDIIDEDQPTARIFRCSYVEFSISYEQLDLCKFEMGKSLHNPGGL